MTDIVVIERYKGERLLANKVKDYFQLIKPSLSIMVVFSSVISYLLAPKVVAYDWRMIVLLFVAGLLVTGSANAINQVVEKDTDALMKRTANRPVAAGRMTVAQGWTFAIITAALCTPCCGMSATEAESAIRAAVTGCCWPVVNVTP